MQVTVTYKTVTIKTPQTVNLILHDPRLWWWYLLQMNSGCAANHGVCRSPNAKGRVTLLMWLTQKPHDFWELYSEPWLASHQYQKILRWCIAPPLSHLGELWRLGSGKEGLSPVRLEQRKMFPDRVLEVEVTPALGAKNRLNWEKYLFLEACRWYLRSFCSKKRRKRRRERRNEYLLVWALISSLLS